MPDTTRFRTIDDVVQGFDALEVRFRAAGDRRAIFVTLYGTVSTEIRARLAQRFFSDNEWVARYAVTFGNLYLDALDDYEAHRRDRVPKAWRLCFDLARSAEGLVVQDMLLGINAHVNHDLPFALEAISIDPDRARRHGDHGAVNAVLASVVERATARIAELYAPGLAPLDEIAGPLDELLGLFSLQVARDSAWESALALSNARNPIERRLACSLIDSRAAIMARLLRAPALSPATVSACRRLEGGPEWLGMVAGALGCNRIPDAVVDRRSGV